MDAISRVRLSGPLAEFGPGLVTWMRAKGYSEKTIAKDLRLLSLLSRWLDAESRAVGEIDEGVVASMVQARHERGEVRWLGSGRFGVVIRFLRSQQLITAPLPVPLPRVRALIPARAVRSAARERVVAVTAVDGLLDDYRGYLVAERGLADSTIGAYLYHARFFLNMACGNDPDRIGGLDVTGVARFVIGVAETRRASSVNTIVVATRSLFRFFYDRGLIGTPLAQAVPWLARGRVSTLPRVVEPGTAERLLAACDRNSLAGARDYAVVMLLSRLGLRVGEVVAIELDDIDWSAGEITIRSKGGARDRLPIPSDVGDALARYLQIRGRHDATRRLFLMIAPVYGPVSARPITRSAAIAGVRRLCARINIADCGTHRLRHSVARDLLRKGAALPEIGQLLRHQELATTAVYAKVDIATLATIAKPWPGGRS